ncbi:MAG: serine hydrolase domain-containing protein [Bradymonadales bacterium]|jgi:CubicO group peptidase (beta-lactamase class C family)
MLMRFLERVEIGRSIGLYSGAQIEWGDLNAAAMNFNIGYTRWRDGEAISDKTQFDVASLTKIVATSLLSMHAVEAAKLDLEEKLVYYWPELKGWGEHYTLADLLSHQTPLAAWHNFAALLPESKWGSDFARAEITRLCLEYPVRRTEDGKLDASTEYTDLGFILLGTLLERVLEAPLCDSFDRLVVQALELESTCFGPISYPKHVNCACTKWYKGLPLQGIVDDDNARCMGGVAGHAGVFSSATDLGKICRALLKADTRLPFSQKTLQKFWDAKATNSRFALAWDRATGHDSLSGMPESKQILGHLGFTGCSLWINRDSHKYWILLSNRNHGVLPPSELAGIRRDLGKIANSE